ncbi:nadX [Symbiodinium sp. KB8]|nr:nadX [Symbiodinium sp. KB8]
MAIRLITRPRRGGLPARLTEGWKIWKLQCSPFNTPSRMLGTESEPGPKRRRQDKLQVGLVGLGSIGTIVAEALTGPRQSLPGAALAAVLTQRPRDARPPEVGSQALLTTDVEAFLGSDWSLCVEAAGQPWVRENGRRVLAEGRDLLVTSVGVFTEDALLEDFTSMAAKSGSRLLLPAGAMPGMDWMSSAALDEVDEVTIEQRKRPEGWRGTPAESSVDLDSLQTAAVVFEGPAREAASQFPKNANIAAALALATVGLDRLNVRLVADPAVSGPTNLVMLRGGCGQINLEVKGTPLSQRTSRVVPFSVLKALKNLSSPVEDDRSVTCASIVGNFLIYAHSHGRLQYYSLVDGQEVNEYKHSNGIRKCYPNHEGTRVALIDNSGNAWLYNPVLAPECRTCTVPCVMIPRLWHRYFSDVGTTELCSQWSTSYSASGNRGGASSRLQNADFALRCERSSGRPLRPRP